jgi:ABC-type oligopeptide transport system substrate-binding subunit
MRMTSLTLAAVAALAISAAPLAQAQTGEKQGTSQAEGSKKEQLEGQGSSNMNSPATKSGTTGTGIGGSTGGNAQRPGGTNNEQMGTQSHDAQKGGSGKDGAR